MSFNNTNTDILVVSNEATFDLREPANTQPLRQAGAFAAFTVDFLIYPLDTIKTRVQSPDYRRLYTSNGTVNRSLFRGLYQGIGSVVLATLPSSGAFFTTYEASKTFLHAINPSLPSSPTTPLIPLPILHAAASSTGELVSCFILTPAEVLKQNAQMVVRDASSSSSNNQAFDGNATRQAFNKFRSNPSQLWRGYTALVARNLPFTAMQFPLFEFLRTKIYKSRERQGLRSGTLLETGLVTAFSAGSAGTLAAVVTTPIDVVKTRIMLAAAAGSGDEGQREKLIKEMQAQGKDAKAEIEKAQQAARGGRAGGLAVGREILRTEGVKGLFR
ncbi:MAG: hypothetical protein Q9224_002717, partial [Gallowayella concinna]